MYLPICIFLIDITPLPWKAVATGWEINNGILWFCWTAGWYDTITVGAFTAYAQKYKHGGLSRLLSQLQESHSTENDTVTNLSLACDLVNSIYDHKMSISKDCDTLCKVAVSGTVEEMTETTNSLQQKVHNSCKPTYKVMYMYKRTYYCLVFTQKFCLHSIRLINY